MFGAGRIATNHMGGGGAGVSSEPAGAWTVANATYASKSFSVSSQESGAQGLHFKDDGTKVYVVGITNDTVYQYSLSTAWDISTGSYDSVSFSVSGQETAPRGLFFKSDGTAFYVIGNNNDNVRQYTLSTAWDLSTASYASKTFSVSGQENSSQEIFFKPDGTKFYIVGSTIGTRRVFQYSMSTAWDVSTASYDSVSFLVSGQETNPNSMFFKPDGTVMWIAGSTNDRVYQYTLSTAWDVSTASYDSIFEDVGGQTSPRAMFIRPNGNAMWILGDDNIVYQYTLS
jgi:sugar lactone lactonase YvrE